MILIMTPKVGYKNRAKIVTQLLNKIFIYVV